MSLDDPRLPAADPVPLTRDSLHKLQLEQMRMRGEPSDGFTQYFPSRSYDSKTPPEEASTNEPQQPHGPRGIPRQARDGVSEQLHGNGPDADQITSVEPDPVEYDHNSPLPDSMSPLAWFGYSRQNSKEPWRKSMYDRDDGDAKGSAQSSDAVDGSISTHSMASSMSKKEGNGEQTIPRDGDDPGANSHDDDEPSAEKARPPPAEPHAGFSPTQFPLYQVVDSITELSAYLAASSYVVSLGGPRQPDTAYGVIIVPVGDEPLLFSARPDAPASPELFTPALESLTVLEEKEKDSEEATENDVVPASSAKLAEALSEQASPEQLVAVQARQTVGSLLAQKPKPKRLHSLAKSIFDRPKKPNNKEKTVDDDAVRRSLLLEIARVATSLANEETPGETKKDSSVQADKG